MIDELEVQRRHRCDSEQAMNAAGQGTRDQGLERTTQIGMTLTERRID